LRFCPFAEALERKKSVAMSTALIGASHSVAETFAWILYTPVPMGRHRIKLGISPHAL
jgi:hypothetical protein